MRDIFADIFANQPFDPTEAARRNMRPALRRRFYENASAGESEGGFQVLLDGRPIRTPAGSALSAQNRALAEAIAAEWQAQREMIDPVDMPLTRLANAIIDGVVPSPGPVREEIAKYLDSDLICYRAEQPAGLVTRQTERWNPVLAWMGEKFGAHFKPVKGVVHNAQSPEAIAAASKAIPQDPWRLGAVSAITTLTGSALLALAMAHGKLNAGEAWAAAHVDEDFQMAQWGRDEIAMARRDRQRRELDAAAKVLALA